MSEYIDTDNTDMRQFSFDVIKGIDLPVWKDVTSPEELDVKRISGAMTNVIFKIKVIGKDCQPLLLRAYGNATNVFFNREKEISYFSILSDNHFGISLVKTFPGGRLEKWRDGYEPLLASQMKEKEISEKIAQKMAEMHMIKLESYDRMEYFQHYYTWAESAKNLCKRDEFKVVRFDLLKQEIDDLVSRINEDNYELVFGHHDLQHCNILRNSEGNLMFVDFEYSGVISIGVDMANHFYEWCTDYNQEDSHILRPSWGPTDDQKRFFITAYLKARKGREPTEEEIKELMDISYKHKLLSDMHWMLWGLLQYEMSSIDWDYWGYTLCRWNNYKTMKKNVYGVDPLPILPL